jgi:hypothetical protein
MAVIGCYPDSPPAKTAPAGSVESAKGLLKITLLRPGRIFAVGPAPPEFHGALFWEFDQSAMSVTPMRPYHP